MQVVAADRNIQINLVFPNYYYEHHISFSFIFLWTVALNIGSDVSICWPPTLSFVWLNLVDKTHLGINQEKTRLTLSEKPHPLRWREWSYWWRAFLKSEEMWFLSLLWLQWFGFIALKWDGSLWHCEITLHLTFGSRKQIKWHLWMSQLRGSCKYPFKEENVKFRLIFFKYCDRFITSIFN